MGSESAVRLDLALVEQGLSPSRSRAQELIRRGGVCVNGVIADRPGRQIGARDRLSVAQQDHYVSRAAHKLLGALSGLGVPIRGRALDAGASTGGFTQVLLELGAERVYAVDVGHGQLHRTLLEDPRVVNLEGLHLRDLTLEHIEQGRPDVIVADVSFISLTQLLTPLLSVSGPGADVVLMVKPQFEVGRSGLDRGGVVTDPALREQAVARVIADAERRGWTCRARVPSPLPGPAGNQEEFVHLVQR